MCALVPPTLARDVFGVAAGTRQLALGAEDDRYALRIAGGHAVRESVHRCLARDARPRPGRAAAAAGHEYFHTAEPPAAADGAPDHTAVGAADHARHATEPAKYVLVCWKRYLLAGAAAAAECAAVADAAGPGAGQLPPRIPLQDAWE